MRTSSAFLVVALAFGGPASAGSPNLQLSGCAVEIVLPADTFERSASVSPQLVSHGPEVIFIPRSLPRDYRISRLKDEDESAGPKDPTSNRHPRIEVLRNEFEPYRFEEPSLLALSWKQVGTDEADGHFKVPAGRYEISLSFAHSDPSTSDGREIELCTVYSKPFTVLRTDSWTRFE